MTTAKPSMVVEWYDSGHEPMSPPSPTFPNGKALDLSHGAERTCTASLPYPAKRIGYYAVRCEACQQSVAVTTAGRSDDPRSVKVACLMLRTSSVMQ